MRESYQRRRNHITRMSNEIAAKYPFAFWTGVRNSGSSRGASPRPLSILSSIVAAPNKSRDNVSISPVSRGASGRVSEKQSFRCTSGFQSSPGDAPPQQVTSVRELKAKPKGRREQMLGGGWAKGSTAVLNLKEKLAQLVTEAEEERTKNHKKRRAKKTAVVPKIEWTIRGDDSVEIEDIIKVEYS